MPSFSLERRNDTAWTVVAPHGAVDAATAPMLRAELEEVADTAGARVLVDLTGVDFLDSTGLGVLVAGLRRVRRAGGALRVVCPEPRMRELFRVAGLLDALDVSADLATALAAPPRETGARPIA